MKLSSKFVDEVDDLVFLFLDVRGSLSRSC
jgi:hypothetical protein